MSAVSAFPQAERRQDLSSPPIPILRPSGRNFCTSSYWTASGSSTIGWHFRLAFASGPVAPEAGLGIQPQILVAPPCVFPDVLRTIIDANVHLLERVAHIIMSLLSNVCMLPATNRKPLNLLHGQTTEVAQPKSLCLCVFFAPERGTHPARCRGVSGVGLRDANACTVLSS